MEVTRTYYSSPIGWLEISGNEKGISSINYLENDPEQGFARPECLEECARQLDEYFHHKRKSFDLDLQPGGTAFQSGVWQQLQRIPFGETISYIDLARKIGNTGAVRAVGHANGQNPINIIIPCHRVIGANGKLTGYGGGLWRKQWLIKHEKSLSIPELFDQLTDL